MRHVLFKNNCGNEIRESNKDVSSLHFALDKKVNILKKVNSVNSADFYAIVFFM
jgi:hypothetical protein